MEMEGLRISESLDARKAKAKRLPTQSVRDHHSSKSSNFVTCM